ncbi:hypothetical protein ACWC86_29005, partial [Streptomyces sp. NPDC001091]
TTPGPSTCLPSTTDNEMGRRLRRRPITKDRGELVELGGMAPASRGAVFSDGWDDGVTALVGIADREWSRRGGEAA